MLPSESTIKARLAAIQALHVNLGLDDPMASMKRVDLLTQGYAHLRGSTMRRHPVTPQMLRWIRTGLRPEASLDSAILWAALLLGFFFLLRASENLAPEAGERAAKGVRGLDAVPRLQGTLIRSFALADDYGTRPVAVVGAAFTAFIAAPLLTGLGIVAFKRRRRRGGGASVTDVDAADADADADASERPLLAIAPRPPKR